VRYGPTDFSIGMHGFRLSSNSFLFIVKAHGCAMFTVFNPEVPKLKIGSPLWKLIFDYSTFQNIFLLFKSIGYDVFFLLIHFVTFS
jgi:hypothetical protein